ncbi:hypothetical protein ABIC22_003372 [Paenibacillus sp. PvP094]|uniref:hypothetical protein n=1 Tax=Paenibacillus sp. PvP094 TaxID=3156394 RepID=UPI003393621B
MKRSYLLLVILLTLSACEQANTSDNDNNDAPVSREINVKNTKDAEVSPNTKENSLKDSSHFLAEDESGLSALDFDTAYKMCTEALTEYYKAIWNGSDIDLDTYIDNENLKQYTQKKITSQFNLFLKNKLTHNRVTGVDIGAGKVEHVREGESFFYFKLEAHVRKDVGSFAEDTEFLVQNVNGKLVIVDWYTNTKDSYDSVVRGENQTIDNPDIWNGSEWAN